MLVKTWAACKLYMLKVLFSSLRTDYLYLRFHWLAAKSAVQSSLHALESFQTVRRGIIRVRGTRDSSSDHFQMTLTLLGCLSLGANGEAPLVLRKQTDQSQTWSIVNVFQMTPIGCGRRSKQALMHFLSFFRHSLIPLTNFIL